MPTAGMEALLLTLSVLFLAFANGANDNFKGVATLHGSGRTSFRTAIGWATVTTFAGSLTALWLGSHLIATFSGKGLVPDVLVGEPGFVLAVAIGAAATVFLATRLGFPISTTHALVGSLVGAGFVAAGSQVRLAALGGTVILPLLVSPLLATVLTFFLYRAFHHTRLHLGITQSSCICFSKLAPEQVAVSGPLRSGIMAMAPRPHLRVHKAGCHRLTGKIVGVDAQTTLDLLHFSSAGAVGFARGLNDTPKIVALLAVGAIVGISNPVVWVGIAMAIGGLIAARRVAQTLSHEITPMNDGQGFSANFVTSILVVLASRFGLPVSTTHVAVGSIFGIGATTGAARRKAVIGILCSWLITLPLAGMIAATSAWLLR